MPPLVGVAVKVTLVPEHIGLAEATIFTLAGKLGFTTICLVAVAVPHEPPLVVKVKVIGVVEFEDAVYVAVPGFDALAKVPLDADQVPPVAPPLTDPPKTAEVPL